MQVASWFARRGVKLVVDVTDAQRSRRPIFMATLWAGASGLFFRVARSTRITQIWALRSRLEKQPTDLRQNTSYFGDRTLAPPDHTVPYGTALSSGAFPGTSCLATIGVVPPGRAGGHFATASS